MNVETLIGELSEHRKLMWTVDMKPGVPRCHAVPLDLIVEAAAALAKLQAEPDREMHTALSELGAITFGDLDERDQGTWFAVKGWRAMIGALLAE